MGMIAVMFAVVLPVSVGFMFLAMHLSPDDSDSIHGGL